MRCGPEWSPPLHTHVAVTYFAQSARDQPVFIYQQEYFLATGLLHICDNFDKPKL